MAEYFSDYLDGNEGVDVESSWKSESYFAPIDIVTRLRKRHETEGWIDDPNVELEAADEIERLRVLVDSMGKALEGMSCHNCDDRKCMDCVFRSQHDKCYDDCSVCTPQDRVRDPFTDRYVERERVLKLWELDKEARRG